MTFKYFKTRLKFHLPFIILIILILTILSCDQKSKILSLDEIDKNVSESSRVVGSASLTIKERATEIRDSTGESQNKVRADRIIDETTRLDDAKRMLTEAEKELKVARVSVDQLHLEIDKLKDESNRKTMTMLSWLVLAATISIGVGAALLFQGLRIGAALAVGSAVTLALGIAIQAHMWILGLAGLTLLFLCLIIIIFKVFQDQNIIKDLIKTTETVKNWLSPASRNKVFDEVIENSQLPETKIKVAEVRKEINKKELPKPKRSRK